MTDWKNIRKSVGYTQAIQSKDATQWHSLARGYRAAAEILNEFSDRIPSDSRPFALNAALSIELILKSILARKTIAIPTTGHDLVHLSDLSGVALSDNQKLTLELLTETIVWSGRYPAPKNEQRWDNYQDKILESHIIRRTVGNVSSVMASPETFPDWKNYLKIWAACNAEFDACA
ncbi:hypothetical protein BN961_04065 [Afipia felis]|uniref:HEPN domain-containing protein n=1 Tax=Afipia felis TaxID=1035 RepID=A0A090MTE0_AFIFE|nr:hypothetical protein [Afipia felis]CEG10625.1 hypothetical protein BN961_04065 [Afipia felis]